MKYLKISCVIIGIFLGSLAGGQISQAEKIINIYEKCLVTGGHCSERKVKEGEMVLNLWSGNLRYYVIGALFFLGAGNVIGTKPNRSNKQRNTDSGDKSPTQVR